MKARNLPPTHGGMAVPSRGLPSSASRQARLANGCFSSRQGTIIQSPELAAEGPKGNHTDSQVPRFVIELP